MFQFIPFGFRKFRYDCTALFLNSSKLHLLLQMHHAMFLTIWFISWGFVEPDMFSHVKYIHRGQIVFNLLQITMHIMLPNITYFYSCKFHHVELILEITVHSFTQNVYPITVDKPNHATKIPPFSKSKVSKKHLEV